MQGSKHCQLPEEQETDPEAGTQNTLRDATRHQANIQSIQNIWFHMLRQDQLTKEEA